MEKRIRDEKEMRIGFVSTWFERGAAYVTRAYIDALKGKHDIFVYVRGGEYYSIKDPNWDHEYVAWGLRLGGTKICWNHFKKWILTNKLDVIFFNEQKDLDVVIRLKQNFPQLKIGSYIDYYKADTIQSFDLFDFLICNTKRHYSVFQNHQQCYYVGWGTDINLFKPRNKPENQHELVFFHSAGLSARKGTDLLIEAFIEGELYKSSRLIIHTQSNLKLPYGVASDDLEKYNINVILETVSAPGLYHHGDVYVYPTYLEGLGLTLYEALSAGLPVITTDYAPMNEVIDESVGKLVQVEKIMCRQDGYYWPLTICNKQALISAMEYYIDNYKKLGEFRQKAREKASQSFDWGRRYEEIGKIFEETKVLVREEQVISKIAKKYKSQKRREWFLATLNFIPSCRIKHYIWTRHEKKKAKGN